MAGVIYDSELEDRISLPHDDFTKYPSRKEPRESEAEKDAHVRQ